MRGETERMSVLGIRAFSRKVSSFVEHVESTGEPLILTRHGRPAAAVIPLNADSFEDFVIAHVPEFSAAMKAADVELARGNTKPLADVLEEIDADERAGDRETTAC